jgi:uncharacterized membrane protein
MSDTKNKRPSKAAFFWDTFLAGLGALIPLFVTVWVIRLLFRMLDGLIPITFHRPGSGFLITIATIFAVGLLARNLVGKRIFKYFEGLLLKIPLVNNIYHSSKEVVSAFSPGGTAVSFKRVVLVEYPRRGMYSIAFVTKEKNPWLVMHGKPQPDMMSVFLPTTPNPATGYFALLPKEDLVPLDISVEEGIKLIISGGIVIPESSIDYNS